MIRLMSIAAAVTALTVLVVVVATRSQSSSPQRARRGSAPDVRVGRTHLGRVLVDARGRTLYLFLKDRGRRSACTGACARVWPPAIVSRRPSAGSGVRISKLTTTLRPDHRRQLVYNGHPLYAMSADTGPGQTNGQGFLGTWFVVSPAGRRIGHARKPGGY
jgi:predicted lipoprotein with Yx(FWY)xxD motif